MDNKSQDNLQKDPEAHLKQVCENVYGESIELIFWRIKDQKGNLEIIFREHRQGWYLQMLLLENGGKYLPEYQVLPKFLALLKPDEMAWGQLTQQATQEDWAALDRIILYALTIPDSEIFFADKNLIGKDVTDAAIDRFGCCVPDDRLLPVFVFENRNLGLNLISYFQDPDRFAGENLVQDHNTDQCEAFTSLFNAQARLKEKLTYYNTSDRQQ